MKKPDIGQVTAGLAGRKFLDGIVSVVRIVVAVDT